MEKKNPQINPEELSAFHDGQLDLKRSREIAKLLRQSPELREQLELFGLTDELARRLPGPELDEELHRQCRAEFDAQLGKSSLQIASPLSARLGWAVALAASIAILLAFHVLLSPSTSEQFTISNTSTGEKIVQILADGSLLEIHPDTRVGWNFSRGARQVFLYEGDILLNVQPGGTTFQVQTPSGKVKVVGTRFRVRVCPLLEPITQAQPATKGSAK